MKSKRPRSVFFYQGKYSNGLLTDSSLWSKIRARHDLDAQVILHFADNFEGVVELPVGILFQHKSAAVLIPLHERADEGTDSVQMTSDLTTAVQRSSLASNLSDFSEDADGAVREGFEVVGGYAGGCFGHFGGI